MYRLTLIISFLLFFVCKTAKIKSSNEFPIVMMEKTTCLGLCPAYIFNLYPDGSATYTGTKNVKNIGDFKAKLSEEQLQNIKKSFEEADFFKFADVYSASLTDLPTTFIYYHNGKENLKVTDYYGAPDALKILEAKVEAFIESIDWQKN